MHNTRVLIVGCGDIGIPLARRLVDASAEVWGLRRNPASLPDFIHPLAGDVTRPETLTALSDLEVDYVVTILKPAGFSEAGYRQVFESGVRHLIDALGAARPAIRRLLHVSSTSVYHQGAGEWVDETSPTAPERFSGKSVLAGEQLWHDSGIPTTVVRFAGIYGPGRRRLIEQVLAGQGGPREPVVYTNRIHRDDCVGVLHHLLAMDHGGSPPAPLYLGVDSDPAPLWEVKHWLAGELGVALDDSTGDAGRRSSKRCSNRQLLASGYRLLYPDFRQGYGALLASGET